MRSAVARLPMHRSPDDRRRVLRAAIRQLERVDLYLDAVTAMELDDLDTRQALRGLLADAGALRTHLARLRLEG